MKQIVYLITSNGVDGMGKESIDYASFDESMRNGLFESKGKNKGYYSKVNRIIDTEQQTKISISKLNALDKLVLKV